MQINRRWAAVLLVFKIAKIRAKEPELPLCPTNMQFFPQNLPMHCRFPPGGAFSSSDHTYPPDFYQSPSPDKLPMPIPFPVPPGFPPGFPGSPPALPLNIPPGSPAVVPPGPPPGMIGPGPFPMPMPMPMPMPVPGPSHKLPVIVMPFYSPDPSYKKRQSSHSHNHIHRGESNRFVEIYTRSPPLYESDSNRMVQIYTKRPSYASEPKRIVEIRTRRRSYDADASKDADGSSDASADISSVGRGRRAFRRNGRRKNRKHKSKGRRYNKKDLLTPILQYVTKDGYVIFEKKISKDEAKDWLSMKKEDGEKRTEAELVGGQNDNKNNDYSEPNEMNADVEMLDEPQEKSKEEVEVQTNSPPRKHFPHKLRNHQTKEEKRE